MQVPVRDKKLKRYPGAKWGRPGLAGLAKVMFLEILDFTICLYYGQEPPKASFHISFSRSPLFMLSSDYYRVLEFQGTNQEERHMEKWKRQLIISKEKVGLVSFGAFQASSQVRKIAFQLKGGARDHIGDFVKCSTLKNYFKIQP